MELCHDLPSDEHQGTGRTLSKIKDKFHWYMSRDIRTFVLTCEVCSKHKNPTRNARCQMTPYHAGAPMERVHLNFMGPLPKTEKCDEYVPMMVDQFTKWTECIPLPSQILFRSSQIKAETLRVPCLKLYVIYSEYKGWYNALYLVDRLLMVRLKDQIEA